MQPYCTVDELLAAHGPRPGRTLVAGSRVYAKKSIDRRLLYTDPVGIDMLKGEGVDVVHNLEKPLPATLGRFDHIDCVSMLEHCERPWRVAENLLSALKPGGSLLVSAPFVWRVHGYPSDYWRFTVEAFDVLFPGIAWRERGYLIGDGLRSLTPSQNIGSQKFLRRAEAAGFGLLVP